MRTEENSKVINDYLILEEFKALERERARKPLVIILGLIAAFYISGAVVDGISRDATKNSLAYKTTRDQAAIAKNECLAKLGFWSGLGCKAQKARWAEVNSDEFIDNFGK